MYLFSSKKIYTKVVSFFVTFLFLVESTLAPVLLLLPQMASAQTAQTITISRTPSTSLASPFKVGDATVSSSVNTPSLFASNLTGTGYNQIGTNAPRTFSFTTFDLVNSGACNATTGVCNIPGNWDAASFACPAGLGVGTTQYMTEWYTIGNVISNKINWYFKCSATAVSSAQTPIGYLDGIDASGNAFGWALDPDSSATSISVHFYIDGAAGSGGVFAGSAVANLSRPDINATYPGNHGFNFSIPQQWRDGKTHKLYVHGIDLSGDGSKNVLLSQTPRSFTLGTVVSIPVASVSPNSFYPGAQMTASITNGAANAQVLLFCRDPKGAVCDDANSGTTNSSGQFSRSYDTTGWSAGTHTGWVTVAGIKSNSVSFTVLAPVAADTKTPIGYLDGIDASGNAFGWALDPDSSATSISVHFYIDGAAGSGGVFAGSAVANLSRPDINATYPGNHGFNFSIPQQWRDGKTHKLYVHGIDLSGDGSKNVLLSQTPRSFTLGTVVSIPVASVSPNSFYPGAQMTTSITNGAANAQVLLFCRDPKGAVCDDANSGTTNSSGQFSRSYDTTGWSAGTHTGWVTVAGIKSNSVSFTVLAPVAADTKTPIGYLDGIDASGNAFGWALDPDSSATSISVHFYIDGAAGSGGVFAGSAVANLSRPDINATYPGNHGFNFSIPQQWRDGKTHKLYVHGIDLSGDGSKNVLLSQTPRSFTLGTVVSIPVASVSPSSFYPGAQMTTSITNGAANAQVLLFCRDPKGAVCDDANSGTTNSSGQFSRSYDTTGWSAGTHTGWVTVAGIKSNSVSFTVLAPVAADTKTPIGYLDGIDASGNAFGWALDPDSSATSISVHFYIDGAAGQGGTYAGSAVANLSRPDINATYPGNHGFNFFIPQQWRDGKTHKLYVHGIDLSGDGSKNVLLSQTPRSFTLGTVVSIPVASVSPSSFYPGAQMTTSVTQGAPNAQVLLFCRDPKGAVCDDASAGTTNSSGQFSRSYDTTGWSVGTHTGWVTVNGVQSNTVSWTVIESTQLSAFPDIAHSVIVIEPGVPASGSVRIKTEIQNAGNGPAANVGLRIVNVTTGRDMGGFGGLSLAAGQKYTHTQIDGGTLWQEICASGGSNALSFRLDPDNIIEESNENNNILDQKVSINGCETASALFEIRPGPANIMLEIGQIRELTAWLIQSGGTAQDVTNQTQWSSSNPSIVELGAPPGAIVNNVALGRALGMAVITATHQGQTAQAQVQVQVTGTATKTIVISRTPATSATNPYKVGDFTTITSTNPVSFFATNYTGTGYNQIGSNPARTFPFSTSELVASGACDAATGKCSIPGNWSATDFVCPAGVTGIQQMKEWYVVNGVISNTLTWYFECSATTSLNTQTPIGYLDGIDASGNAFGWALDQDSSATSISVHFYIDGAAGQGGVFAGSAVANLSRPDLNSAGYPGNHGFNFSIPAKWRDGKTHKLYVHGIDLSGDGSKNVLLRSVPKNFTLGTSTTSATEVLSVGATAVYKGDGKIWVASRINADTILFERWNDPLSSTNTVWRSKSQDGAIISESSLEIHYQPVTFYDQGMPADVFGQSDGPYDIWLAPTGLYIARSGQTKTLTATRIGYGTLPAFYSRQWCGLGTICNKALAEDQWDGWPIFGFMLQEENGTDIASIFTGPLWLGFEIIQASLIDNGTSKELRGQSYKPCSAWTTTLGLCQNGVLYMAGANEVLRVKLDENNLQWWYDSNFDGLVGCEEFGKTGAKLPDAVVPHAVAIKLTDRNSPTRAESSWTASKEGACITTGNLVSYPVFSLPSSSFVAGVSFVGSVTQAVPNTQIRIFSKGPDGVTTEYTSGITSSTGTFSQTYNTVGWASGAYQTWVDVNGVQSNIVSFTVTAPSASGRFAPTPTTAPMATLTLEREQEQVLPDQPIAFSGTLDSALVAFPQGSSLFIAIPEKTAIDRIEIDSRTLGTNEFSIGNGSAKVPFSQALYNGSHPFRIVLRNEVSLVPQLDRNIAVWVSVVGADNKLLLKGRTASTLVAHLPIEVIGRGTSIAIGTAYYNDNSNRVFRYLQSAQDVDITRGPFFTPTSVPPLPDNIAFTLFPGDATMQRIALTLKSFSDPLAREFITAQYQYLLGRDPSSEEVSRYLPMFTQWRNSFGALMEVYNRRADVREFVRVPEKVIKDWGGKYVSNLPNYDKLIEWAMTQGWKEEPTLQSFKMQTGYDDAWKLFAELQEKWAPLAIGGATGWSETTTPSSTSLERDSFTLIFELCGGTRYEIGGGPDQPTQYGVGKADFAACWNNPIKRHQMILWAKDIGWAYNKVVQDWSLTTPGGDGDNVQTGKNIVEINPAGPILASVFGPGKYSEYVVEQQWRYPPAQMYYDLISSPEYASSIQQRFRTNIDSILRLFYSRPVNEDDIVWVKNKFLGGIASFGFSDSKSFGFDRNLSWINDQWEPNGQLIASNFNYIDEVEFVKNPQYINDYVYGIRHIPGEIDAVSSRLVETIERRGRQELYRGDNFKRIVSGLYRLYLRRNPTDAEVELRRASGKDFGDIELKLNQSSEYGDDAASPEAIRNLYRNYLGRDPSDADIALWPNKTISGIANKIGTSAEMKEYAQQHPENAYIFPIKEIKIKKCGFFCSVFSKILTAIPVVGTIYAFAVKFSTGFSVWGPNDLEKMHHIVNIVLSSVGYGFDQAGFNGKTFVQHVSIARAMAGHAGGAFSMTSVFENADPTILEGFRTMALAPQAPKSDAFAKAEYPAPHYGFASLLSAVSGNSEEQSGQSVSVSQARLAQIDVSGHYGGGFVGGQQLVAQAVKSAITKKLVRGSRGAEVLLLQKILGETDLTFSSQYQTGYYGPKTEAAVKRFQKRYGLAPVGFVGPKTKALLNSGR